VVVQKGDCGSVGMWNLEKESVAYYCKGVISDRVWLRANTVGFTVLWRNEKKMKKSSIIGHGGSVMMLWLAYKVICSDSVFSQ
jgi:hypothetical protein